MIDGTSLFIRHPATGLILASFWRCQASGGDDGHVVFSESGDVAREVIALMLLRRARCVQDGIVMEDYGFFNLKTFKTTPMPPKSQAGELKDFAIAYDEGKYIDGGCCWSTCGPWLRVECGHDDLKHLESHYTWEHVVEEGETLGKIAQRHNVSVKDLASQNGVRNQHLIRVGQVLSFHVPCLE